VPFPSDARARRGPGRSQLAATCRRRSIECCAQPGKCKCSCGGGDCSAPITQTPVIKCTKSHCREDRGAHGPASGKKDEEPHGQRAAHQRRRNKDAQDGHPVNSFAGGHKESLRGRILGHIGWMLQNVIRVEMFPQGMGWIGKASMRERIRGEKVRKFILDVRNGAAQAADNHTVENQGKYCRSSDRNARSRREPSDHPCNEMREAAPRTTVSGRAHRTLPLDENHAEYNGCRGVRFIHHSTVTLLARFLGLSTLQPRATAA
jgi:hypothetical protein